MIEYKDFEDKLRKTQPLIIIGMHRSGTSLVVRLLNEIGIHLGINLSRDAESIFFQKINRRIFKSAGSNWGNIDLLLSSMEDEKFIEKEGEKALRILFPPNDFLGIKRGVAHHFGPEIWPSMMRGDDIWWGWKDPRTTMTFPIWLKVFPKARILHVLRNGIDVAISTHRRSQKQQSKFWKRIMPIDFIPQTLNFNYCYGLWEKYVSYVIKNKLLIQPDNFLEIQYEDLLSQPMEKIKDITSFIEYPIRDEIIKKACMQINKGRRDNSYYTNIYKKEIQSIEHYELLDQLGYHLPLNLIDDEVNAEK